MIRNKYLINIMLVEEKIETKKVIYIKEIWNEEKNIFSLILLYLDIKICRILNRFIMFSLDV